jgi:hypothetical protein
MLFSNYGLCALVPSVNHEADRRHEPAGIFPTEHNQSTLRRFLRCNSQSIPQQTGRWMIEGQLVRWNNERSGPGLRPSPQPISSTCSNLSALYSFSASLRQPICPSTAAISAPAERFWKLMSAQLPLKPPHDLCMY